MSWCVRWAEAGQLPAKVPVPVPLEESAVALSPITCGTAWGWPRKLSLARGRRGRLGVRVASGKFWSDITTSGYVRSADGG